MQILLIFLLFVFIGILLAFLIDRIIKKRKFLRYFFFIVIFLIGVYKIYYARSVINGEFTALGIALLGIFIDITALSGLIYTLTLDIIRRLKK
ncbi:hypothetical protein BHF71_02730 [Vulcanibacillus modesticaldus]|uniref:Uncharacterized protein n=1 Tax=Vulcanibacillus modesticaldus TaxID=337097 RepID=A0A1D2YT52_9BACI|nr:hypothetical protein [Vulcanibacillus modesticaldus]OEF98859.1 hypothetical protein BHF71_02730 [Vulcanibacillus modesticaldus]